MSKHLAELCTLLVDEFLGHLPSCVFSILLTHGRLPLPHLVQRSRLPSRCVKAGLAVLVQHHLIQYLAPSDDDPVTIYEANVRHAYNLLRFGKNGHILHTSLGEHTGIVAENLLLEGCMLGSQVRNLGHTGAHHESQKALPNGHTSGHALTNGNNHINSHTPKNNSDSNGAPMGNTDGLDDKLFSCGYALQCRRLDYMPEHDFDDMIEGHVLSNKYHGVLKGTEAKEEFAQEVRNIKRRVLDGNRMENESFSDDGAKKKKRKRGTDDAEPAKPQKQRKLNGGAGRDDNADGGAEPTKDSQASVSEGAEASEQPAVRLNYDKLDVALRNEKLITLAARSLGEVPAKVYRALLLCIERKVKRCFDVYAELDEMSDHDDDHDASIHLGESADISPSVTTSEIEAVLDSSVDLATFIDPHDTKSAKIKIGVEEDDHGAVQPVQKKNGFRTKMNDYEMTNGDEPGHSRISYLKEVLGMLNKHHFHFVHQTTVDSETAWRVNFPGLSSSLIQIELENFVNARFGPVATRVVRFLQAKGRVEEKTIANTTLLTQKDARAQLSALQQAGLVDVQEVPKDTARQPKSTIFLWVFNQDRSRRLVLNDTYKTMSRFLQRLRIERVGAQTVLEKVERSDIRGREEEFLSPFEKKALHEWEAKEEKILVELNRLDDTVAILRDFLPPRRS